MNRFTWFSLFTVSKHHYIQRCFWNESYPSQCLRDRRHVISIDKQINITGCSDRSFVNGGNPRSNCIATNNRVLDSRSIKCTSRSEESFTHFHDGALHAIKNLDAHANGGWRRKILLQIRFVRRNAHTNQYRFPMSRTHHPHSSCPTICSASRLSASCRAVACDCPASVRKFAAWLVLSRTGGSGTSLYF